jgi:hypothetical protein
MIQEMHQTTKFADDLKTGRPERYYDYIYQTYGDAFRSGSIQALETFRELLRQILAIGNERSILLFADRFFPLLPLEARQKIFAAFLTELGSIQRRTPQESAKRVEELLAKPKEAS